MTVGFLFFEGMDADAFFGSHAALSDTPQKTLQMNEAQNRPGAAAQIRTVECGGEKASDGAFF
ncbi:hypothetical protein [Sutterella wadsworthensis]|uniref:hypothetical protein n=1 Tax=Sutterella wadsworthensis TaxID=40545 RepID=UPI0013F5E879|nr:hypothetical protein [Sutterella wadsworthensis]